MTTCNDKERKKKLTPYFVFILLFVTIGIASALVNTNIVGPVDTEGNVKVNVSWPVESNGGVPVNIQDQVTPSLDLYAVQNPSNTTLAENATINEFNITASPGHGITDGQYMILLGADGRVMTAEAVAVSGNEIELDQPINTNYSNETTVIALLERDMNVDGSIERQTFFVTSPVPGVELDITRIMIEMQCATPPSIELFCDQPSLERGIYYRRTDGTNTNYWNIKNNGDLSILTYDVTVFDQNKQGNFNGIVARNTYAGPSKHGVAHRVGLGERLEFGVQDDLTVLPKFRIMLQGHIKTD